MQRFPFFISRSVPLWAALLLCAGWAGAAGAACGTLAVDNAWVPAAPPSVSVMAAYFKATNTGDGAIELTAVSSPQFERAHMHQTVVDDSGTASMQPVETIKLAPGETIVFEPGGYHVMLFQPKQTLAPGDSVTLALHCGNPQASLSVVADVRKRMSMEGGMSQHGHMHHGMRQGQMHHEMDHGGMHDGNGHGHMNMEHGQMQHDMSHEHMDHDMG